MLSAALFVLLLSLLVFIHEMGHFLVAKWRKVRVSEFGLGYPPLAKKLGTWKGTVFSLNWIPFGGFVRLEGEEATTEEIETVLAEQQKQAKAKKTDLRNKTQESPFFAASSISRLAIIAAGPVFNLVYGVLAFAVLFSVTGIPESLHNKPRVAYVEPNSPAAVAGISTDVEILAFSVDTRRIETPTVQSVQEAAKTFRGKTVELSLSGACQQDFCQESLQTVSVYLRTESETPAGQGIIGVQFYEYYIKRYPWYEMPFRGAVQGFSETVQLTGAMFMGLGELVRGLLSGTAGQLEVAGPIGIVYQAQRDKLIEQGWMVVLQFSAVLSINLAVMNILPIPALDGGRIFVILLESMLGRRRVVKVEHYLNYVGFVCIIGLIVFVTFKDIMAIVRG